jgi:phytoene dehydrogenase-like protein
MPFWINGKGWAPIQEQYSGAAKQGLKRCIQALNDVSYDELETWNHASLREWMAQYTSDEGVYTVWEAISVLEQITLRPWEHSASENLYTRKLHYSTQRTAGYSFWPMGGWDALWHAMVAAFEAKGGEIRLSAPVRRVDVRDGAVQGVTLRDGEEVPAPQVVVSAPVWDLLRRSAASRGCGSPATPRAPAGSASTRPRARGSPPPRRCWAAGSRPSPGPCATDPD